MKRHLLTLLISFSISFLTFAQAPVNPAVNLVFATSAILEWERGTCAQLNYTLAYKDSTQSNWDSVVVSNNGFTVQVHNLTGLNSLTTYNWRVKCDTTWVNGPNFTTTSIFNFNYNVTDASCSGSNDGAIDMSVNGGSQPYTYLWSSPIYPWFSETTEDIDTLFPGLYYIDVTDALGSTERDSVIVSIVDSHSINQNVSNFSINPVTGYGQWTNTILQLTNTGCDVNLRPEFIISHDSVNIIQGDFDLQWFNPLTGQFANLPYNINSNGEAYGFWHYTSNGPNPDSTGITVNEGATQLLTVRVRFNNNPTNTASYGLYSCIWNTQEVDSIGNIVQTLAPADTLDLRFSDCASFSIDSLTITNILCYGANDGSATISSVNSGFGSYSYNWSNGDTNSTAYNLSAGNYSVIINDNYSGCQDSTTFILTEASPIQITLTGVDVSCNGASDGSITSSVSGTGSFSYSWSSNNTPNNIAGFSYGGSHNGSYYYISNNQESWANANSISLSNGGNLVCISDSIENNFVSNLIPGQEFWIGFTDEVNEGTFLWVDGSSTTYTKWAPGEPSNSGPTNNEDYTLINTVEGGMSPSDGYWNDADDISTYKFVMEIPMYTISSNQTSISNLSAGTYTLTVYDSLCNLSFTDSYTVTNPDLLNYYSSSLPNASCDSTQCTGLITATLSGGTQPYQYNWSNGSTQQSISNLCAGTYTLIATDSNSCQTFYDTIVIIDTVGSASFYISSNDVSCFGLNDGSAEAIVSTGTTYGNVSLLNYCASMPYSNANVNISEVRLIGDNGDDIVNNTSTYGDDYEDFTNQYASLTPNSSYTVTIEIGSVNPNHLINEFAGAKVYADWNTDGDFDETNEELGIINIDTVPFITDVTFTVPNTLSGYVTRLRVVMQENNDTLIGPCDSTYFDPNTVSFIGPIRGATEDYSLVVNVSQQPTFLWSNGETTQVIDSLSPGTYSCVLTDANNCTATDSITITEPSQIIDSLNIGTILCNGGYTTASLTISGGIPPYTETWSSTPNRIYAGTMSYTITDSTGCQVSNSFTVTQPSPTILTVQILDSISCFGGNDGALFTDIVGGVAPFTYIWTNNANNDTLYTDTITNLIAARYFCTITDSNNCVTSTIFSLPNPNEISVIQNNTNILCHGDTNGVTILNISGGDGNYTLSAFGQTLPLLGSNTVSSAQFFPAGIPAGIYPFSVSDGLGCIKNDTIIITQPNPLTTINTVNNISCYGLTDGSATLNIIGGTPPYVEDWGGFNPNALAQGTYFFTVTDSNNCSYSDSITITEPDSLYYSALVNNISCYGFDDGNVSFTINGGTPPYYENWGASDPLALTPGMHYYSVSDTNGCSISDSVNINEPSELIVTISSTNITCYGGNNGTATLTISGGTSPYFEDWFGYDPTALFAGTYTYTVTDTNNCFITDSITITQSQDSLTSTLTPTNLSSCLIMDGSIDQSIIGGTPPYTYLWNNGDTTEDISNLMAGTYSVTTTDTNGCFTTATVFVDQPSDSLRLSLSTQNFNGFNIACYGDTNGTISAITSGGYGLLSYNWSNGDTTLIANNLYAGSFSVTVTDTAGCSLTDSTILIEPTEFTSTYSTTDVLCYNDSTGSATVTFNGGVPDYLLAWGSFTLPLLNGQNVFASGTIIPQGLYPYSATDLNGCTIYDTITINQPDSLFSSLLISDYNGFSVSCEGGQDAVVNLILSGGTSPYNASFNSFINLSVQNELDTTNVPLSFAGTYNYTISDTNGCLYSDSITLTEPPRLSSFTQLLNNVSCYDACDGAMTVLASGGISPYNYIWNNDSTQISDTATNLCSGNYTVQVLDANNCISNSIDYISQPNQILIGLDSITNNTIYGGNIGNIYITLNDTSSSVVYNWSGPNGFTSNSEDIVNLYAGTYILNTTDSLACSLDTFIVEEPLSLSASLDYITNNICWGRNQGAIAITADGGDSVYTYLWTGPNGFTSTDEDIDSLYAGIYTLELSDTTNTISYSYTVLENDEIIIFSTGATAICDDGSAVATAYGFGGTPPLNTYWSNGDTGISTTLSVGTHAVTVIDVYGCNSTDSVTIEPGDSLSLFPNSTMVSCYDLNDGIVEVLVTNGGTPPYQYSDDGGLTYQSSNTFYNLSPGNHTFTVLDNNGCSNDITTLITQPLELGVDVIFTNLQCFNDCDATATAIVDNGTQPYSYEWTDPSQQLNQTAINLCAGSYNVTVTDANGCVTTGFVSIVNPDPIIVNVWQYENMLEATSGFVSYQWLDDQGNPISGETSNEFFPTSIGEYSVEVTDSNGCTMISLPIYYNYTGVTNNEMSFNIYPNPTSSTLFINGAAKISEVEIYNALGDKVIHHQNEYSAEILEFDLSNKTRGVYFVKIISGNKLINYKIVLQ